MTDPSDAGDPESLKGADKAATPETLSGKESNPQGHGRERRRQHPDILSRIARGETEATALAFLNKELALSAAKKVAETDPDQLAES
jgi:hypothetical protein